MSIKDKVLELKNKGYSYNAISKELGIPVSTAKTYLRRDSIERGSKCKHCGAELINVVGKKLKKFCSDKCRMTWWNSHRDDVKRNTFYTFKFPCCNSDFVAYGNKKRIYCSIACFTKYKTKRGNKQ